MANRTIEVEITAKAGRAQEAVKGFNMSLTDLKSGIDLAMGAARLLGQTAKQAFDFTKEGASIIQTTRSFEGMGLSIEALRDAAGGTIDDMTLMSSALTLLAGAGGELEPALSGALPALLEMARASNKLNPALGDTSFLFESLATGIKRGSPMILDNLGITVNLAKANEDYARALGKSVDQLTDEEKKIALLNATLDAGNTLIEQAGGSVDSYTDSWTRAESAMKNATDMLKSQVAPSMEGTVTAVARSTTTFAQLVGIIRIARDEYGFLRGSWEAFWSVVGADTDMMKEAALRQRALAEGAQAAAQGFSDVGASAPAAMQGIEDAGEAAANAAIAYMNAAAGLGEMATAAFVSAQLEILRQAMDAGKLTAEQYEGATRALLVQFGLLTPAEESAAGALDALREMFIDGRLDAEGYAAAVQGIKSGLDALESKDITIGVNFAVGPMELPPGVTIPQGMPVPMAAGGDFLVTQPTLFLAGEAGPERATFTPQGGIGGDNARAGGMTVNIYTQQSTGSIYRDLQLVEAML